MNDEKTKFWLRFEGASAKEHRLPALMLVRALEQFQKAVHYIAMVKQGIEINKRARVPSEIEKKFSLICDVSQASSFAQPVHIGERGQDLFTEEIDDLSERVCDTLGAINEGNEDRFLKSIPSRHYRNMILKCVQGMQPSSGSGIVLNLQDYRQRPLIDGRNSLERIEKLKFVPEQDCSQTLAYVNGTLVEMKFNENRLRLQLLNSKRSVDLNYGLDFEEKLFELRREVVQIHGNIVYDTEGVPETISDIDDVLEIDQSPIYTGEIRTGARVLQPVRAIEFHVAFNKETELYEIEGEFGVILAAETRPQLESILDEELAMLWQEYAKEDPENLTDKARQLRDDLLASFKEADNAS